MHRTLARSTAKWVLSAGTVAAAVLVFWGTNAFAGPTEYDYHGNVFTSLLGNFPAGNAVTGNIILNNALPTSQVDNNPSYQSFSFTDGVHTISNTTPGVNIFTSFEADKNGKITFGDVRLESSALGGEMHISEFGDSILFFDNPPIVASNSTPGTWSAPPAPSLFVTLEATQKSRSGEATVMSAILTLADTAPNKPYTYRVPVDLPPGVKSLKEAADDLAGYTSFDWTQTITVPDPAPERKCNSLLCDSPQPIAGPTPDVPLYGWDYCNPNSSNYDKGVFGDCSENFPFYYNPKDVIDANVGTILPFSDSPADGCLQGSDGHAGIAYMTNEDLRTLCNHMTVDGAMMFKTTLVGVKGTTAVPLPFEFTWDDTFNGWFGVRDPGTGGIITLAAPGTDILVDPESGTGGITITSVNGVPTAASVPEPSSAAVFMVAILMIGTARKICFT